MLSAALVVVGSLVAATIAPAPAVTAAAPAPTATATATGVPAAPGVTAAPFSVLVFSKTAGFRHDSIPAGIAAIRDLGAANGFSVAATEDAAAFTDANLAQYAAVIWLSTTGDVLDADQQAAFERYIRAGGGYVGVHAASDTEYGWQWYGELVGAYFASHPANQQATVKVEDPAHPSTSELPAEWSRFDEWYNYRTNPRSDVHVLASLDETSYAPGADAMGHDHPIAWCHDHDGGRAWYTGGGHTIEAYADPEFRRHLLGGIRTASGALNADCAASLTDSFEKVTLDSNTSNPMELDVAPDGRVFYIERDGRVQIIKPDTGLTTTAIDLDVFSGNEDGLIGIKLDPDFAANNWVYLYYAPNDQVPRSRLARFTVTGDTLDPTSEKALLHVDTQRNTCCHAGGGMAFDADANLYLATGDNTNPFESNSFTPIDERPGRQDFDAQRTSGNTNDLRGKVLRIHPEDDGTYTVPDGNLFPVGTAQARPEIYGMGFRNPFRIGYDKTTSTLYVADFGPDAPAANPDRGPEGTVEWNAIGAPGNFGWPYCHGNNYAYNDYTFPSGPSGPKFNCAAPVNTSPNNTGLQNLPPAVPATVDYDYSGNPLFPEIGGGGAPMGGPVYRYRDIAGSDREWPAYYDGKAMFGEWNQSKMYAFQVDGSGTSLVDINQLLTGMSFLRPMDFEFGPDGALYMIEWGTGFGGNNADSGVYRIDYVAGERAPIAVAGGTPTSGQAPLTVQFSSAGSRDPDGGPLTYAWTFGDGGTSTLPNPDHTYTATGNYTAQLTVTNPAGLTAVVNVPVTVGNTAPTVVIEVPPDGGFFDWGDQVNYTVRVTDPEDGQIDCSRVILQYYLGHDEHGHPLQRYTGCTGTVQTSLADGHGAEANVFAVFEATYTDNGGTGGANPLTGRAIERLQPKRKQAEYFAATGRTADGVGGGNPGVQREATGDAAGGFQNIGFIEDGDWWSFDPADVTGIRQLRLRAASASAGGRIEVRTGSTAGPLLATATIAGTGDWQVYADVMVDLPAGASGGPLYLVARNPVGSTGTGSLFNVNWIDFLGRGVSVNARPDVAVSASPQRGTAPMAVQFTGAATDPDGDTPLAYAWDFGDGATANTLTASHTYTRPGTFTATLTVTDSRGASGHAATRVTVTAPNTSCFGARSDDFTGPALDRARWSTAVRESQTHAVRDGALVLPTAVGDLYGSRNDATDIVLQPAPAGPWQATTRISAAVAADYQQAGLIVYGDDDNYAKLDLVFSGAARVEFIRETAGTPRNEAADSTAAPAGGPVYLRLTSDGTNLTAAFSNDGQAFTPVGRSAGLAGITEPKVGLFALQGGTAAPVIGANFDWFQVSPDEPTGAVDPSDEFTAATLDKCRWNTITREDPAAYRIDGGALQIDVPNGDIYGTNNTGPTNFILQTAPTGAWTLQTRIDGSAFTEQYQQGGLLVYADDDNYLKLDFIVDNVAGQPVTRRLEFRSEIGGVVQNPQPGSTDLTSAVWHLRLNRSGDTYTASYSADGTDWTSFEPLTNAAAGATPKVGLFSLGGAQQASKPASFDYFRLTTAGSGDTVAPVTTATFAPPNDDGWHAGTVPVTLAATDSASGVASVEYALDGGPWTPYTQPVDVTGDGGHELLYRATDNAGNVETVKSAVLTIDATKPILLVGGFADSQLYGDSQDVRVTFQAVDPTSGIKSVVGTLDGRAYQHNTLQAMYELNLGMHELVVTATDRAGNQSTSNVRFFVTTSFRDMQNLHDRFKATSRLSAQAHRQLSNRLTAVRQAEAAGNDTRAIRLLNTYRELVADPALVTDPEVRAALTRDADAMIIRLGGPPGTAANGGNPLTGTGRLPGGPTKQLSGRL